MDCSEFRISGIFERVIGLGQGMTYFPEDSKVVYRSKDGKEEKIFAALEWLVPPIGGILMCQTRENRWLGITATIVTSVAVSGKNRIRTA